MDNIDEFGRDNNGPINKLWSGEGDDKGDGPGSSSGDGESSIWDSTVDTTNSSSNGSRSDGDGQLVPMRKTEGSPESQYQTNERYVGTRALWLKVIIRAVFDWVSYRDNSDIQKLKLAESARNWLFEKSEMFNGFENVCDHLSLAPEKVRKWAKSISKEQVAKIEHLDRDSGGSSAPDARLLSEVCELENVEEF